MSAVVVAGGASKRFGQEKGLIRLASKPLILHVLDRLDGVATETVVVVSSKAQKREFAEIIKEKARVIEDTITIHTPLVGALAGFEAVQGRYTLLLACDTPFLSSETLKFLLDMCANKAAAIPRWPNGNIEPLHAAYQAKRAAEAARKALTKGKLDMRSMIANMRNVRYISTLALKPLDPEFLTFFNINTLKDLTEAETMMKRHSY